MKASVQYNDFKGTAAADISDHTDLAKFLQSKGVDTKRYYPVGVNMFHGVSGHFYVSIICQDCQNGNNIVRIAFEEEQSAEEFFGLFKRFNVILISRSVNLDHIEGELETIYYDNRPEA